LVIKHWEKHFVFAILRFVLDGVVRVSVNLSFYIQLMSDLSIVKFCHQHYTTSKACKNLTSNATTNLQNAKNQFPPNLPLLKCLMKHLVYECLNGGTANAIAIFYTYFPTVRKYYSGKYEQYNDTHSRDVLAPVTREDDQQWSSFVT
jgi:hypothetical protein